MNDDNLRTFKTRQENVLFFKKSIKVYKNNKQNTIYPYRALNFSSHLLFLAEIIVLFIQPPCPIPIFSTYIFFHNYSYTTGIRNSCLKTLMKDAYYFLI